MWIERRCGGVEVFVPCSLRRRGLHSGTLKLCPHTHGIQCSTQQWRGLHAAYRKAGCSRCTEEATLVQV